ncbi:hypothetical protein TrLO_g9513 [Triparma laevis f. longispina]|uniref:Uncharacterized protein n=1 Tax=Triparma laevis f. longispina TaxID=1714387 RepID=A0A9W7C746_9STRA|nr:hypothetical protein TrLO_g9513 [Triparma laevis f. longispina]
MKLISLSTIPALVSAGHFPTVPTVPDGHCPADARCSEPCVNGGLSSYWKCTEDGSVDFYQSFDGCEGPWHRQGGHAQVCMIAVWFGESNDDEPTYWAKKTCDGDGVPKNEYYLDPNCQEPADEESGLHQDVATAPECNCDGPGEMGAQLPACGMGCSVCNAEGDMSECLSECSMEDVAFFLWILLRGRRVCVRERHGDHCGLPAFRSIGVCVRRGITQTLT